VKSMSASGSGVFTDAATDATINGLALSGALEAYDVVVPGLGTFTGSFLATEFGFDGEHNGEVTFSLSLESSAAITFVAAP